MEALCWLAGLIVCAGCVLRDVTGMREFRDKSCPWIIHTSNGWYVDMEHPEWRRRFDKMMQAAKSSEVQP